MTTNVGLLEKYQNAKTSKIGYRGIVFEIDDDDGGTGGASVCDLYDGEDPQSVIEAILDYHNIAGVKTDARNSDPLVKQIGAHYMVAFSPAHGSMMKRNLLMEHMVDLVEREREREAFVAWRHTIQAYTVLEVIEKFDWGWEAEDYSTIACVFVAEDEAHIHFKRDGVFEVIVGNWCQTFDDLSHAALCLWNEHSLYEWRAQTGREGDRIDNDPLSQKDRVTLPTLTPLEALYQLRDNDHKEFQSGGFEYSADGPQGSPKEHWFPIAVREDGVAFYPDSQENAVITFVTKWRQED